MICGHSKGILAKRRFKFAGFKNRFQQIAKILKGKCYVLSYLIYSQI
jgi:hypothetical protein